jgi:hypothetical protein
MNTTEKFEQWALVELSGHQRIAGRVSEQTVGGCAFVRVDVPACEAQDAETRFHEPQPSTQAITKLYGQGAIYAITFVDEPTARMFARQLRVQPISTFELRRAMQDLPAIGNDSQRSLDDEIPY